MKLVWKRRKIKLGWGERFNETSPRKGEGDQGRMGDRDSLKLFMNDIDDLMHVLYCVVVYPPV